MEDDLYGERGDQCRLREELGALQEMLYQAEADLHQETFLRQDEMKGYHELLFCVACQLLELTKDYTGTIANTVVDSTAQHRAVDAATNGRMAQCLHLPTASWTWGGGWMPTRG